MTDFKGHILGVISFDAIIIVSAHFVLKKYFNYDMDKFFMNNILFLTVLITVSVMFSLLPDIDTNSVGGHIYYFLFFVLDIILMIYKLYKWAAILGLFVMLPSISKHRGFTHTKIFGLLICLPFLLVPIFINKTFTLIGLPYFIAAIVGYYSHLLFDGVLFRKK